ncbi:hypothetical protein PG993_002241 [Apiospora rasikravindrae]|uniref:Ubiquinol-cytochrome-c reductase cytochrome c1 n=1 Tax=Apiospora rasikravindrae TaxID=990691 RepID=A0ABR1TYB7_9PEZI
MDNNNTSQDEHVIYLALKDIFSGVLAEIRQDKAIRRVISKNSKVKKVADLQKTHKEVVIVDTTRRLLSAGIFESTQKARVRFPNLFNSSPVLTAKPTASQNEARQDDSDFESAKESFSRSRHSSLGKYADQGVCVGDSDTACACLDTAMASQSWKPIQASAMAKQLFPVHLPFSAQHKLLVHLQQLLERSCYEFTAQERPQYLQQQGWDCAEAVELNHWVQIISKRSTTLKTKQSAKPLEQLFASITNIRHTAVHRNRVSAAAVEGFFRDAEAFTALLGDAAATKAIALLRREIQVTIEELERNTQAAHSKLNNTMHEIGAKREELRRLEKEALEDMQRDNVDCQGLAGRSIDAVLGPPESLPETTFMVEKDTVVADKPTIEEYLDYQVLDDNSF